MPSGPMFDRSVDVNWGVRLANTPAIKFSGKITVNDPARKLPMMRSNVGIPVGNNAIDIQDFDGSGVRQIPAGAIRADEDPTDPRAVEVPPNDRVAARRYDDRRPQHRR